MLSLDAYAKTTLDQSLKYELMKSEEDQDNDEEDSEEEFKKDDFLDNSNYGNPNLKLSISQFTDNQPFWKLNNGDILLPPPKL